MRDAAATEERSMPLLCPRINLEIETTARDDDDRKTGVGNLAQVLQDLDALAEMGSEYVVLDTYRGQPDHRRPADDDWRMLEAVAKRIVDT